MSATATGAASFSGVPRLSGLLHSLKGPAHRVRAVQAACQETDELDVMHERPMHHARLIQSGTSCNLASVQLPGLSSPGKSNEAGRRIKAGSVAGWSRKPASSVKARAGALNHATIKKGSYLFSPPPPASGGTVSCAVAAHSLPQGIETGDLERPDVQRAWLSE